jgi:TonB family protein
MMTTAFLLETAVKGTALLGAAWVVAACLGRNSAAVRHQVWLAALAAVLVLPFCARLMPRWRVPLKPSLLENNLVWRVDATSGSAQNRSLTSPSNQTARVSKNRMPQFDGASMIAAIWALGTLFGLAQMMTGLVVVKGLRRRGRPILDADLARLNQSLGFRGEVEVRESKAGTMPITCGWLKPMVLLPADAVCWSAERRRVVLLHELAHVRRGDGATQLVGRLALAVYWWNPMAWKAWREFLKERERAADDLVLSAGAEATEYAGHLLEIARSMQWPAAIEWGSSVAMARPSQLEGRLSAILDRTRNRKSAQRASAVLASIMAGALLLPVAALEARSEGPQPQSAETGSNSTAGKLVQNANLLRESKKPQDAKPLYEKALRETGSTGPDAVAALMGLGKVEMAAKDYSEAMVNFERAEAADSKATAAARLWEAIAQERQDNLVQADGLYQSAMAVMDPSSSLLATSMELYARLLVEENRREEAEKFTKQALTLRKSLAVETALAAGVFKIGGDVKAPILLSKVEPEYSEDARLAKYSGSDLLSADIGPDGLAHNITVVRGLGFGLDQKAIEAISQWKFKPGTMGGQPVKVNAHIEVNFRLL